MITTAPAWTRSAAGPVLARPMAMSTAPLRAIASRPRRLPGSHILAINVIDNASSANVAAESQRREIGSSMPKVAAMVRTQSGHFGSMAAIVVGRNTNLGRTRIASIA